jgi:hypothetical protein
MKWGCVSQVVSGDQTLFQEDVWIGQVPLKITFPKLYNCCKEKKTLLGEYKLQGWGVDH